MDAPTPPAAPPRAPTPPDEPTLYERIGGAEGLRRLTRRFYALMDQIPEARACRAIHPADLSGSEQKLFEYLSGWLGGPPLFTARHGHPMLRARHLPMPIGPAERDGWLVCFHVALNETVADADLRAFLLPRVASLAMHMQNRD